MTKTIDKDNPHQDIGKSKFRVKKFYTVEVDYEVVAKTQEEADDAVREHGGIEKIEWQDGYHEDHPVEMYCNDWELDYDTQTQWEKYRGPSITKVEECVPCEDYDFDTKEDILDYSDPDWTTDSFRWNSEEDQNGDAEASSNTKDEEKNEIPF